VITGNAEEIYAESKTNDTSVISSITCLMR